MSSAFVKSKLKAARDAIGKKDYQSAHDASEQVLDYEPDNYNAYGFVFRVSFHFVGVTYRSTYRKVFLGLSLLELGQIDKSEQVTKHDRSCRDANSPSRLDLSLCHYLESQAGTCMAGGVEWPTFYSLAYSWTGSIQGLRTRSKLGSICPNSA